jgi:sulfopropanediol 3-dehydrogenase
MSEFLKQAPPHSVVETDGRTAAVSGAILDDIARRAGGRRAQHAAELDGWTGEIVVPPEAFRRAERALPQTVKDDLRYARDRVCDFARRQRDSLHEFEAELRPGSSPGRS